MNQVCTFREGNGTPLQYSCLENPMDGGAWCTAVYGVAMSRTQLSNFTFTFHFHALEKETATHSSVLAWRIPGTGKPGGLPSLGSHRVRHNWSDLAAAAAASMHFFSKCEYLLQLIYLHMCISELHMVFNNLPIIFLREWHSFSFLNCSVLFSSVHSLSRVWLFATRSTPGLPVHHQLPESIQTHVHRVSDAIQPSNPLSSPSPPALNLSQHQGLFQ